MRSLVGISGFGHLGSWASARALEAPLGCSPLDQNRESRAGALGSRVANAFRHRSRALDEDYIALGGFGRQRRWPSGIHVGKLSTMGLHWQQIVTGNEFKLRLCNRNFSTLAQFSSKHRPRCRPSKIQEPNNASLLLEKLKCEDKPTTVM